MKPAYQFPIPPLRPFSKITFSTTPVAPTAASSVDNANVNHTRSESEPMPKRIRLDEQDEIAQQHNNSNAFERLFEQFANAQHQPQIA